jgi:hypothetical protein
MARTWGATRAKFWDIVGYGPGLLAVTVGGDTYLETVVDNSVTWTRLISQIGQGAASFYAVDGWDDWLTPGRVCVVEKVTNHTDGAARLLACFIIEDIEPKVANGVNVVDVRGPGLESMLTKQLLWSPIGSANIDTTQIAVDADAPSARTLAQGAPAGVDHVELNTSNSDDIQQEIRITLDDGRGTHITTITERWLFEGTTWYLNLAERLPYGATSGNAVEVWTRRIRVDDPELFLADVQVYVDLDDATTHATLATGELDTTNRVTLRDGLPDSANTGNEVLVNNPFAPATNDIEQIIGGAPGWTVVFQTGNGTAQGSAHKPQGESVFDLLSTISQRTGEFFRQRVLTDPNTPHKSIEWRRTPDSSGVTLIMYDTDEQARQATDETSLTKGAILSLSRKASLPLITVVFPSAGDQQITLSSCSSAAISYASSLGCSIVSGTGLYEPSYVKHNAGYTAYGMHEVRMTYGDISIGDATNMTALTAACDQLLLSAVQTLVTSQAREYYTVDCYCPIPLLPGQTVKIENATGTTPAVTTTPNWVILEVTERLINGRPRTTLSVSNMSGLRWTPAARFAQTIRSVIQSQRRATSGGGGSGTTTVITGTTGEGTSDHGELLGLADDDHPQYFRVDGSRAMTGSITLPAGVTIDGVDLSAHVANANAHHAAVTVQDASLAINGQALRIADAHAGAGLVMSGGIASVNTAAAQGTGVTSDVVAVVPSGTGGLELSASGVKVKTPANSGLVVDSSGVALGTPGTLSATSTNTVSGSQQTHAITSTDNAKTTPATLLKGSAAGDLTVRYLTGDQVTTPLVNTASGGLRLDPANGVTTNDGNLSFVGARQIDTDTGSLTLSPAQTLVLSPDDNVAQLGPTTTLKTAHWASGFLGTGWGVTYDGNGDFRTLYADELHVAAFIADTARVAVGAEYITPSMALIARPFTIPAVNGNGTLYVEDAPGMDDTAVFAENDWVLLRIISRAGGGLLVANVWGQVTGYQDRADGQQSWVFTTKSTTAAGQVAQTGAIALDFGKSGDGWWWVTTLDEVGSPYAGITTWSGANPYDSGNRTHRLRMGQLKGVSGAYEWGLQAGTGTGPYVRFSDLRSEIHGTRLSLYAGDGGRLQVSAVDVIFYRTGSASSTLAPDADGAAINVETTGASYFSVINEGTNAPNHNTYISNTPNMSGAVLLSLSNPAAFTSIFRVDIKAALRSTGLTNDTVRIYGQVFASDLITPLTGEVLLATRTSNTTATVTVTAPHEGYGTVITADWTGARLRLRWEYAINANEEAIRLDPSIPSLAVGNPLPTDPQTGGDGLWTGAIDGGYALRIGGALNSAPQLLYNGASGRLAFRSTTGEEKIVLDVDGSAYFGGPMTIATGGGIWQGTGSFASPTTGLKIYNSSGVGRLSTYNAGLEQITLNTSGQLVAGAGALTLDRDGAIFRPDNGFYNSDTTGAFRWLSNAGAFNLAIRGSISDSLNDLSLALRAKGNSTSSAAVEVEAHKNGTIPGSVSLIINGSEMHRLDVSNDGIDLISPDKVLANTPILAATEDMRIGGGAVIGDVNIDPLTGVLVMKERTADTGATVVDTAQIWVQDAAGVQKLYIKFANGVQREIATA